MCVAIELDPGDMYKVSMGIFLRMQRPENRPGMRRREPSASPARSSARDAPGPISRALDSPFTIN